MSISKSLRKKHDACIALCSIGRSCSLPTKESTPWCPQHNEERIKLYANYKSHHAHLNRLVDDPATSDLAVIRTCTSLSLLREWNDSLWIKYNLLTRCIEARVYFTERFFGNDMDFGHKAFWDNLVKKRREVEEFMHEIENRASRTIFEAQNALWVLDREPHDEHINCSGYDDTTLGTHVSFRSTQDAELIPHEDPLEAALRDRAIEFREKIRARLARYCAPPKSAFHEERLEVIYAYVRRAVYTEPPLMLLAQKYNSVMDLLNDSDMELLMVEKLWDAIRSQCVHDVRAAVDDVLRAKTEGDYAVVLGGKVFRDESGESLPLHAWGHMMAFYQCYSCLRGTCKTMDDIVAMTRYAIFAEANLSQSCFKYEYGLVGAKELVVAGFIPSDIPFSSPRHSVTNADSSPHCEGPIWQETKRNLLLYAALSTTDPKAQAFVNGCLRHPDLMVMLRKGADGRVIRSTSVVWTSRKRHARSLSTLSSVAWDSAQHIVDCKESILEEAQPLGWDQTKITDCFQVVIVDAGDGNMGDFVRKLLKIWCQVYQVESKDELYATLENGFYTAGELEKYTCSTHDVSFVLPIVAKDVLKSYTSLWGTPPPTGLVEDPVRFQLNSY
ncbi:hypothetical protein BJ138DRAFT_1147377 [Hygrophoropsis aurantiaca]|uniref:Uncharacterized protein n=1 Tax=Hygrophoropsis aurantiaca TaxID=72124 RepID=A0ACB8AH99_9AGAM|nr:hypothetical protein BJ138DRAFT_1147377 [Hygrophoropsis aurantiaca]